MKNRLIFLWIALAFVLSLALYAGVLLTVFLLVDDSRIEALSIVLPLALLLVLFGSWIYFLMFVNSRRIRVRESFDTYVEDYVAISGIGVVMFDENGEIYWNSQFIAKRFNRSLIGKKISAISDDFNNEFLAGKKLFRFNVNGIFFEARVYSESRTIVLRDVTSESVLLQQYTAEKNVLGEMEIDNFQQFQVILPEEELFKVQAHVIGVLDDLVEKYGITYRQYSNGKYLVIANHNALQKIIKSNFDFLDAIRSYPLSERLSLTVSAGFGIGTVSQKELIDLAKDGLAQAQARGGDQVAITEHNRRPRYYGSKVEASKTTSRVKIKQVTQILEARLRDSVIKNVIIYGHAFADLDAIGSAMGIYELAKAYGKEAFIQNATFDATTAKVIANLSHEDSEIFIRRAKAERITAKESTIVVIVDTAELDRTENPEALDGVNANNIFIFDHHRVSKLPKTILPQNMYVDTSASSASEIVCEVLQFADQEVKLSKTTAQMLLNGIYLDTKLFTKSMSARTFAAASWLELHGAQSAQSAEIMKLPAEYAPLVRTLLSNVQEIRPGYFIVSYDGDVPSDVVSIVADEMLRIQDRKAAFVVAKVPGEKKYKLSARGIDTNVQIIAEAVGGGGHFSAAAAVSDEPLTIFVDNIIQAVVSAKGNTLVASHEQAAIFKGVENEDNPN